MCLIDWKADPLQIQVRKQTRWGFSCLSKVPLPQSFSFENAAWCVTKIHTGALALLEKNDLNH